MVKKRLIPVLYIKNGLIVRSEDFIQHQIIGNIINEASRYNEWDVDELIYIDISRDQTYDMRRDDHKIKSSTSIEEIIENISKVCFMPLTFGGGLRTTEQVDLLIKSGADKVTINTGAFENPNFVTEVAKKYGSQCIVLSVDYKLEGNKPIVYSNFGETNTNRSVTEWVKMGEDLGAGEIFLNSIDRDGKANGYDVDTISKVCDSTKLPVIACGGAGDFYDFLDLIEDTNVSAVAAGNIFHFTERAYPRAKQLLKKHKVNVR